MSKKNECPEVLPPSTTGSVPTKRIENAVRKVAQARQEEELPTIEIGDTVDVHLKLTEKGKQQIQVVTGTVIARSGSGVQETFTVRPSGAGEGFVRTFSLHSAGVKKLKVKRPDVVRRVKLGFLGDCAEKAPRPRTKRRP